MSSGAHTQLAARHLVGRSRNCHLRISKPSVSGLHAQFVWDGSSWQLQDLGSRNGTYVDKRKLQAGESVQLREGAELTFGVPSNRYRLVDTSPPQLMALSETGDVSVAEDELLCLPSIDVAELVIFCDAARRWLLETHEETRGIEDQESVLAGGKIWRVCLPANQSRTRESETQPEPAITEIELVFEVSRDNEHVSLTLRSDARLVSLEPRAHNALLLVLAEARRDDATRAELPESEHGWLYREQLIEMLAIDGQLLNLWVYRSRRQLSARKIRGAANIIERRQGTQQMRIGSGLLSIKRA